MALSKFNKFLIYRNYAILEDLDSGRIRMTKMIDLKKLTKEFNDNDKNMKRYYYLRSIGETSGFKFMQLKKNLVFY